MIDGDTVAADKLHYVLPKRRSALEGADRRLKVLGSHDRILPLVRRRCTTSFLAGARVSRHDIPSLAAYGNPPHAAAIFHRLCIQIHCSGCRSSMRSTAAL